MAGRQNLAEMDIKQAVLPPNGNGLATIAFTPSWGFLGVLGWKHVEEGVEAWVCDGEVLTATTIARDLRRIIGHRQFVRRVILRPEPLQVQASGKTSDLLDVALEVSIAYRVVDPIYAAATSEPLVELREAARGAIMQFVPSRTYMELVQDDTGETRRALQAHLINSAVFAGHFAVEEVLSAAPAGDQRLTEIGIQTRLAQASAGLIEQEGRNKQIAAAHDLHIQQAKLEQDEEFKRRQYGREFQSQVLQEQGATARAALDAVGKLGSAGTFTADQITQFLGGTSRLVGNTGAPPESLGPGPANAATTQELPQPVGRTVAEEEDALASIAQEYGILDYHVFQTEGKITGASVKFRRWEISFTTDAEYPQAAPTAVVVGRDGDQLTPSFHWFRGRSTLADAVLAILAKLPTEPLEGGDK